jgi:hypothetical protein
VHAARFCSEPAWATPDVCFTKLPEGPTDTWMLVAVARALSDLRDTAYVIPAQAGIQPDFISHQNERDPGFCRGEAARGSHMRCGSNIGSVGSIYIFGQTFW